MPDPLKLFDRINKANISQRDKFILMAMVISVFILKGYTELTLAKQIPALVEWLLKLLHVI